jgi:hypothetical protein
MYTAIVEALDVLIKQATAQLNDASKEVKDGNASAGTTPTSSIAVRSPSTSSVMSSNTSSASTASSPSSFSSSRLSHAVSSLLRQGSSKSKSSVTFVTPK